MALSYAGPDTGGESVVVPRERLYLDRRERFEPITEGFVVGPQLAAMNAYVPRIQDMQRTYIRAFKAQMILALQGVSAAPATDSGRSELDVLSRRAHGVLGREPLPEPRRILNLHRAIRSRRAAADRKPHQQRRARATGRSCRADAPPQPGRCSSSSLRTCTTTGRIRRATAPALKAPLVRFFQEVSEAHPDTPMHGLVHALFHEDHAPMLLAYFDSVAPSGVDLVSFPWLLRLFEADRWMRDVRERFGFADIRTLRPDLIAAEFPLASGGNANLTQQVRAGAHRGRRACGVWPISRRSTGRSLNAPTPRSQPSSRGVNGCRFPGAPSQKARPI